jgi:hypothetical protein
MGATSGLTVFRGFQSVVQCAVKRDWKPAKSWLLCEMIAGGKYGS